MKLYDKIDKTIDEAEELINVLGSMPCLKDPTGLQLDAVKAASKAIKVATVRLQRARTARLNDIERYSR